MFSGTEAKQMKKGGARHRKRANAPAALTAKDVALLRSKSTHNVFDLEVAEHLKDHAISWGKLSGLKDQLFKLRQWLLELKPCKVRQPCPQIATAACLHWNFHSSAHMEG